MTDTVLVLGAKGRLGRAAVIAFAKQGWKVRAFARSWEGGVLGGHADGQRGEHAIEYVTGDALMPGVVSQMAKGCDVIVNGLNPPYAQWQTVLPALTKMVIAAGQRSGATIVLPGNVYGYGETMPPLLTADIPYRASTQMGRLRVEMEQSYGAAAAANGVRTIIVQAGDFIEREKTGNWFDSHICAPLTKGAIMYPGPLDQIHAWAYLPDLARAMSELAKKRNQLPAFCRIGFPGYGVSGGVLIQAIGKSIGRELRLKSFPWRLIKVLAIAVPNLRALSQLSYLWRVPHQIDGAQLALLLPQFEPISLDEALADVLGAIEPENAAGLKRVPTGLGGKL